MHARWDALTPIQQKVAEVVAHRDGSPLSIAILTRYDETKDAVQGAVEALEREAILLREHGRPFRGALVDPLFELWIASGRHSPHLESHTRAWFEPTGGDGLGAGDAAGCGRLCGQFLDRHPHRPQPPGPDWLARYAPADGYVPQSTGARQAHERPDGCAWPLTGDSSDEERNSEKSE